MADKPTYSTVSGSAVYSATDLNNIFDALATAVEGCLGRGGTAESPNSMTGPLDMDLNKIQNLPAPSTDKDAANKKYVDDTFAGTTTLPVGVISTAKSSGNAVGWDAVNNNTIACAVENYSEMRGLSAFADGDGVVVMGRLSRGDGGGGVFYWDSSDLSTQVTADPKFGIYSPPTSDATGASGAWVRVIQDVIYPEFFGATGDGATDDTEALQAWANYMAVNGIHGKGVPGQTYLFSTLLIKNGTPSIDANGSVFLPDGTTNPDNLTTEAAVVLQGALTGGTAVSNCSVKLELDMQNGDRTAILGDGVSGCLFQGSRIYGFTDDATYNHRGLRLQQGASNNWISNNEITGVLNPTQRGLLLDIWCDINTGFTEYGGFFTGTVVQQGTPAERNVISGNILTNGSYALNLQGGERNIFANNTCTNQNHRGVWMGNGSWFNTVANNSFRDFTSAAVLTGYSCNHNVIVDNSCINEGAVGVGGEATININTGSSYNLIANNYLDAPLNYSVYVATDSSYNTVDGNYSKNAYVAAFATENDWIDTLPTNCFYGRPNYVDPDTVEPTATSWTFNNLEGNVFENNTVHSGYSGRTIAAFYVGQIENDFVGATATDTLDITIKNNTVLTTTNIGYGLYMYEHVAGQMSQIKASGNTWDSGFLAGTVDFAGGNTSSAALDLRDVGLVYCQGNGVLDDLVLGTPLAFTDADTTPSVQYWSFYNFANTGATSVTDFDDGATGQEIILRLNANTTIVYNASLIRTKGSADIVGSSSNELVSFKYISGVWLEQWRNF